MERKHTFDFLVEFKSGWRIAYAVKPKKWVERSGIERTLDLIREQVTGFADEIELMTEWRLTRNRADNAQRIVRALRMRNNAALEVVKSAARGLKGAISIRQLLSISLDGPDGLCAVHCLIGDGVLKHVGKERLSLSSHVALAPRWRKLQQQKEGSR